MKTLKNKGGVLAAVALGLMSLAAATTNTVDDLDVKIALLSKKGTTVEEVLRVLGEPEFYRWGHKIFTATNLPDTYLLVYPK